MFIFYFVIGIFDNEISRNGHCMILVWQAINFQRCRDILLDQDTELLIHSLIVIIVNLYALYIQ